MSDYLFPPDGTLQSKNLPAAMVELLQLAIDADANAPEGVVVNVTYSQTSVSGTFSIPAETKIIGPGQNAVSPLYRYEGTLEEMPVDGWKMDLVDGAGRIRSADYSRAIIEMAYIINDAERIKPPSPGQGLTQIHFLMCSFDL